jgi:acyl carrier protein
MSTSTINQKVIDIIADKLAVAPGQVRPEANITTDLGADSLDYVELLLEFERVFGITIPEEEAEQIKTVGQVVAYLEEKLSTKK